MGMASASQRLAMAATIAWAVAAQAIGLKLARAGVGVYE
jgi:hypothetical protein